MATEMGGHQEGVLDQTVHPISRTLARKNGPASACDVLHGIDTVGTRLLPGIPIKASQGRQLHVSPVPEPRGYR